ncbi:MAG TPA: hypothetical protein VH196_06130 [Terriglobales bacterium]|jgi:hypothetical protein|nr:hypothetical protein [Terriglobales bacterium]
MITAEIILAILVVVAVLVCLLDKTTPSEEACLTALKATIYAILALPVATWMFISSLFVRTRRKLSSGHASFQR